MILKAYYEGGRIDVFDTDHLVDGVPQSGNLLTNYTLDLADVNGESLWLRSYYYEASAAYKEESGPTGFPVARRRDGWSFLIADENDIPKLNRLTVDGETVLVQIAGELVDVTALSNVYNIFEEYGPMSLVAYRHMIAVGENCGFGGEQNAFETMGMAPSTFEFLQKSECQASPNARD
ncbi:hypothetical protein [Gordonibacter sp. RACS_AR49]|uniref:hypothetical protein n=1 Tax=Gordonibacter sp. RACS_AR49 TaxID=2871986 RepID=UPI002617BEDA|nr:hypothetical protein [Gordonibacter sp. RACS_AR49]MDN4508606.1 hypothetical protein [Gordonibacter sp. RACS_AR49]